MGSYKKIGLSHVMGLIDTPFDVNFNLLILSKPKALLFQRIFSCSVVARVLRTLTRFFFRKWFWQRLIFGMTTMAFGLVKPSPGQKSSSS